MRLFMFSKAMFRQKRKTLGFGKFISFFYKVYSSVSRYLELTNWHFNQNGLIVESPET